MTQEYESRRHCIVITAGPDEVPSVFPVQWGLHLGDIVHNYRSSLDHLAWALYKRGRTPNLSKWQEQGVYFPIASTPKQFNDWLRGSRPKLPGVRPRDLAIVRRYQPFKGPARVRPHHVFRVLDELAIADKHRLIQPIEAVPESGTLHIRALTDCTLTRVPTRRRREPFKPGMEIARFYVRKSGPDPFVDVEPSFRLDPTVDGRFTFQEWGHRTMRLTAQLLSEFAKPPESVRALLSATSHGAEPAWLPR